MVTSAANSSQLALSHCLLVPLKCHMVGTCLPREQVGDGRDNQIGTWPPVWSDRAPLAAHQAQSHFTTCCSATRISYSTITGRHLRLTGDLICDSLPFCWSVSWKNNNNDNNRVDSAIRTNHIKARIDKTQQNSKFRLCGDRDETINHIISECSKLAQREYKARHDWVGKVIHWEMCKKFKFNYTNKWYMHNPAPVLENATHKLLWDFNIQTDQLIPARRPGLIIINKKKRTCKIVDFAVPTDHRIKLKECERKDKYLDFARELKNCGTCKWQLYQL